MSDYTLEIINDSYSVEVETSIDCSTCSSVEIQTTEPNNVNVSAGFTKEDIFASDIIGLEPFILARDFDGGTP